MIPDKPVHRFCQNIPQLEFIASAKVPDYIPEPIRYTPHKMNGQFPAFPVLTQMLKEKIVQPILDDVLDHIVPAVLHQEEAKRSEITVGQRLFVHIFQYLLPVRNVLGVELVPQLLVKSIIKIVLQYFFAQVGPASLIPQDIAKPGTVLGYLFSIKITGKTACAQVTHDSPGRSAQRYRCPHKVMGHMYLGSRKSLTDSFLDDPPVVSTYTPRAVIIPLIHRHLFQRRQQFPLQDPADT